MCVSPFENGLQCSSGKLDFEPPFIPSYMRLFGTMSVCLENEKDSLMNA